MEIFQLFDVYYFKVFICRQMFEFIKTSINLLIIKDYDFNFNRFYGNGNFLEIRNYTYWHYNYNYLILN